MQSKNTIRQNRKKLCENEITTISARCRERFLPLDEPGLASLQECGITFAGVSVLHPGYEIHRFHPRWHTLVYTLSGEGRLQTQGHRHHLRSHTLWIGPAGVEHHYAISKDPWKIAWLCLEPGNRLHLAPEQSKVLHTHSPLEMDHLFRQIIDECDTRRAHYTSVIEHYARLVHLMLKRDVVTTPHPAKDSRSILFEQLVREVRNNPGRNWDVKALMDNVKLSVSKDRFRQLCLDYLEKTPRELVTAIRMESGAELLMETDYCVYTIASMVGYENEYAFSTAFRRTLGLSPRDYRNQGQAKSKRN
jgi:AraC-like DNA-binding protein